ncbi:GDPD-domain-containing protein [Whalleya microplaca]|nr:GDPD-domain-containing protein [Whalleya microplaca]
MRFGQNFPRYLVPEWDRFYIDYNGLKQLIKASFRPGAQNNLEKFYEALSESISVLEFFRWEQDVRLAEREADLCTCFGLPSQPTTIPDLDRVDHLELSSLRDAYEDFRRDLARLQWFDRVNEEAADRIFLKLQRSGQAETSPYDHEKTRWRQVQGCIEETRWETADRIQCLVADINRCLGFGSPGEISLYLSHTLSQNVYGQISQDAVYEAIKSDNTNVLCKLLRNPPEQLLPELFSYSILCQSWNCVATFLTQSSPLFFKVNQTSLNFAIILAGQITLNAVPPSLSNQNHQTTLSGLLDGIGCPVPELGASLVTKDKFGRLPLHYAAKYGLVEISRVLLGRFLSLDNYVSIRSHLLSRDMEGLTPLHYAVIGKHAPVAKTLLDSWSGNDHAVQGPDARRVLGELLLIALRSQEDDIFHRLLHHGADLTYQSTRGETALHVAAQFGREDYVKTLLQTMSEVQLHVDVSDSTLAWTPLFIACSMGHRHIVKSLLKAGASQTLVDNLGWTAKEHAVYRGYLDIAELFEASGLDGLSGGPVDFPIHNSTLDGDYCKPGEKVLIGNLGCTRKGLDSNAVKLPICLPEYTQGSYIGSSFVLEISAAGSTAPVHRVRLPILSDQSNDNFAFPIIESTEPQLTFNIFRSSFDIGVDETLIASGTALLKDDDIHFGTQRQSLVREHTIAILEKETMNMAGTIMFTYVIAKPFPHLQTPRPIDYSRSHGEPAKLVGHRGLGQNTASREYLQLGENTVTSFLSAARLGASFVELDVQVTRDHQPVIYHDFSFSESGTDIPVHDLTIEQYKYVGEIQAPQGSPVSVLHDGAPCDTSPKGRKRRSRSLDHVFEAGATQVQDRLKYTVDYKNKRFKPNTRGAFIQDSYTTLEELLVKLPIDIGFCVEMKYPRLHETIAAGAAPICIELNTFIDVALSKIHQFGSERHIILSSFTPEVCILLSLKQKAYPVMFITNAGKLPIEDKETRAASLQAAVQFAKRWNLAGVVFACETLLLCPRLVRLVKNSGLICASYGLLNNIPQNAKTQADSGVDIIMADRVGLVAEALKNTGA